MKLFELLNENIQWAVGHNVDKATRRSQHDQNNPEFTLIQVNIKELFKRLNKDQQIDLKSSSGEIKGRIPRAKQHWEQGGVMDPSIVGYNEWTDTIDFTDGRHRIVAAYQSGEKTAPVLIPSNQVDIFKKLILG